MARRAVNDLQLHRQILHQISHTPQYLEQRYSNLETPALIVWGTEDKVLNPLGAETLRRLFLNSEVKLMSGIGHLPMLEAPELATADFLNFQKRLSTMPRRRGVKKIVKCRQRKIWQAAPPLLRRHPGFQPEKNVRLPISITSGV